MKRYNYILDEDGSLNWFVGKMAQDMAKTIKIGRPSKKIIPPKKPQSEKDKHLQALKELQNWLDKYDDSRYDDYKLQVKAEIDRILSKYFRSIGVNHAKLGR